MRKFSDTLTSLFDAVVDPPTPESRRTMNCELAAGAAVDRGALLAGPLAKRSEWLHAWNVRFCSLFTSHFTWQRTSSAAEGRAVPLQSAMAVAVRDECLCVQLLAGPWAGVALWFRPASDAELQMWAKTLRQLLDTLQARRRHHHTATSTTSSSPPLSSTERSARRQAPRQDALDRRARRPPDPRAAAHWRAQPPATRPRQALLSLRACGSRRRRHTRPSPPLPDARAEQRVGRGRERCLLRDRRRRRLDAPPFRIARAAG